MPPLSKKLASISKYTFMMLRYGILYDIPIVPAL